MKARISIRELKEDGKVLVFMFGGWFWTTSIGPYSKSGFARTESKAREKAERAARGLVALTPPHRIDYVYPTEAGK